MSSAMAMTRPTQVSVVMTDSSQLLTEPDKPPAQAEENDHQQHQ